MPDFGGNDQSAAYENAANIQAQASAQAAQAQLTAARESNALIKEMYQTGRADLAPWMNTGQIALDVYSGMLGLPSMYSTALPTVPGQKYPTTTTNTTTGKPTTSQTSPVNIQSGGYYLNADGSWTPYKADPKGYYVDEAGQLYPGSNVNYINKDMSSIGLGDYSAYIYYGPDGSTVLVKPTQLTPGAALLSGTGGAQGSGTATGTVSPNAVLANYNKAVSAPSNRINATEWIKQTPGYQFQFGEGINALDRSAASRGMLLSGAQTRAAQDYGQNFALGHYDNYMGKLANLAGIGQSSAQNTAAAGQNMATASSANTMTAAGNAAQANMAGANAIGTGYVNAAQANQGGGIGGMIGGGLSGAAMGYRIGGWPGAAIGGGLGILGSIFR